jgi:hypothetical protein
LVIWNSRSKRSAPSRIDEQKTFADSDKSWSVDVADIDRKTFDLSVKNPNGGEAIAQRSPQEIMEEIAALAALKQSLLHQAFAGEL